MEPGLATSEVSGNVRIDSSADELVVTIPATRSPRTILFATVLGLIFLYFGAKLIAISIDAFRAAPEILFPSQRLLSYAAVLSLVFLACTWIFWMILQFARPLCGGREILRCTRDCLQISNIDFGKTWRIRTFAIQDIRHLEFASVGFSRYGAVLGLRFTTQGKTIKLLRGLEAPEAQKILIELEKLGVGVVKDPAIGMMVEMKKSRRTSSWGIFK